ncbi:MAG: hypothetical protein KAV87_50660 [Desulfobacteraceae bacterium]|nr:hypothetical protein [Desulfobacteraceae bacterium]
MSNLKFPIDALKLTLTIISSGNPTSAKGLTSKANQADGMNRAISILRGEKRKDEIKEREKREIVKEIRKGIVNEEDVIF